MRTWTNDQESEWLKKKMPEWHTRGHDEAVGGWLTTTTNEFIAAFPSRKSDEYNGLFSRVRCWYYYHGRAVAKPQVPAVTVPSRKPQRKVTRLTPAQAYSRLFCSKGSALHTETREKWEAFVKGDVTYAHLFPGRDPKTVNFLGFSQAVFRVAVSTLPEDELRRVEEYIEERFVEENDLREHPWKALKVDDALTDEDLERQYTLSVVNALPERFQEVLGETKEYSNFNTFLITGGPCAQGNGGFKIFFVQNGRSVHSGQTFEEFLGPMFNILKDKYLEWLASSYTNSEILRKRSDDKEPSALPSLVPRSLSPEAVQTPQPQPLPSSSPTQSPTIALVDLPVAAIDTASASTILIPPETQVDSAPSISPIITPSLVPAVEPPSLPGPSTTTPSTSNDTAPEDTIPPPPNSTFSSDGSSSQHGATNGWPPQFSPTWELGPQHPAYVHAATPFLIGVPGGPEWMNLLECWVVFESLTSSETTLEKMPSKPRPKEVSWWFQIGRRLYGKKHMPKIASVKDFEGQWIQWWTAAQPDWRSTGSWPFPKGEVEEEWGRLSSGGKDGLFLVVMSLGWWAHARDPTADSVFVAAIGDVSWVIQQLITSLSARAIAPTPPPDAPVTSSQRRQRTHSGRAERSRKRLRV